MNMFLLLRGVGGVLLVLLGLYVASLRPRQKENVAFATFCALTGAGFGSWLISPTDSAAQGLVLVVGGFLFASAGIALARVAIAFPRPLAPADRALARNAAIVSLLVGLVQGTAYVMRNLTDAGFASTEVRVGALVEDLGLTAFRSAAWFGGLLAVMRFASVPDAPRAHHQALAVFGVSLALYPAVHGPYHLLYDNPWDTIIGVSAFLLLLLVVAVLLRGTATTTSGSAGRWAAWILLGASAAQMFHHGVASLPVDPSAVSIVAMFAILTYAILRHQLLGLDVKLRFAISKSTIAAIFIAVFFIASEAAQQFFGETFDSNYLGIAAAGALVFAMAPLQRAADRLAEKAVPPALVAEAAVDPDREEMYRSAVRLALRNHRLSRSEERELFHLARGLGLEAHRAHEILGETEELQRKSD